MKHEVSNRAILVKLSISTWAAQKFDKRVTTKVTTDYSASVNAGRWNKHLLAGAKLHKNVLNAAQNARLVFYQNTLPWTDEGWRLLPTRNFFTFTEKLRQEHQKFDEALNEFIPAYPQMKQDAKATQSGMHQDSDYPTVKEVERKFSWNLDFNPVPEGEDFRVNLPPETLKEIETATVSRVDVAVKGAMQDTWKRLHATVARVKQAASPDGKVYDDLMDRTRYAITLLGDLNVTNDPDLERFRKEVEDELTSVHPQDIRESDIVRGSVERKTDDIIERMKIFYTPQL